VLVGRGARVESDYWKVDTRTGREAEGEEPDCR
jgi:hypothetical protein